MCLTFVNDLFKHLVNNGHTYTFKLVDCWCFRLQFDGQIDNHNQNNMICKFIPSPIHPDRHTPQGLSICYPLMKAEYPWSIIGNMLNIHTGKAAISSRVHVELMMRSMQCYAGWYIGSLDMQYKGYYGCIGNIYDAFLKMQKS